MSLATRCTACGTIFRVVQDQLRVSEGWVRCGRCAEVFDAREQLFDMDREAPPPWPPVPAPVAAESTYAAPEPSQPPAPARPAVQAPAESSATWTMPREDELRPLDEPEPEPKHRAPPPPEPEALDERMASPSGYRSRPDADLAPPSTATRLVSRPFDADDARREPFWDDELDDAMPVDGIVPAAMAAAESAHELNALPQGVLDDDADGSGAGPRSVPSAAATSHDAWSAKSVPATVGLPIADPTWVMPATADILAPALPDDSIGAGPAAPPPPTAGFLRQAEGAARWRRPGVRLGLSLLCLLLLGGLAAQLGWHYRSVLAALLPQTVPTLQALCERAACTLEPWKRIDALDVQSSKLAKAGSGNHYQLQLMLSNKAAYELALPWVELSLTDAGGELILRRTLRPADFNISKPGIAGHGEQALQLVFSTGSHKVSGYTVEIFHP